MQTHGITLLGLGPGNPQWLTLQASEILNSASEIYFRTNHHPVVSGLHENIKFRSFDYLFASKDPLGVINAKIAAHIVKL